MSRYLHQHPRFIDLLQVIADEQSMIPTLVEKDYWIMHCLHCLQKEGYEFQLKGGTSLSKGFGIINRFSEDIDIRIEPPAELKVKTGKNHDKPAHRESRRQFYDWLKDNIAIEGIERIERDYEFDDEKFRSGGIRLHYAELHPSTEGIKEGILLEVGFDEMTPNEQVDITSWAYNKAFESKVDILDNRALKITCYNPAYTFVEKLQTIATKYRNQQVSGKFPKNFLRHYYDVSCLLADSRIQKFIGSEAYTAHKNKRFPIADLEIPVSENEAFKLSNPKTRALYKSEYERNALLYYHGQIPFDEVLGTIQQHLPKL